MSTYGNDDFGMALVSIILTGMVFATVPACNAISGGTIMPFVYPHEVTGRVAKPPTTRYVRTESGGQEKVAITLDVGTVGIAPRDLTAGYHDGHLTLECTSTRCTQMAVDEQHTLKCRVSGRFFTPNVVTCVHVREE